jgi:drug/metabolite transporter (DMT)-like permease
VQRFMTQPTSPRRTAPFAILAASVLVVSFAAILIRIAQTQGVPSMAIAMWRLGIAAIILSVIVLTRAVTVPGSRIELRALSIPTITLAIGSGVFLAAHFASWIASLSFTSVASSTALVTTNPIWIALVSWLVFRERLGRWLIIGIAAAITGSALIFLSDSNAVATTAAPNPMLGNGLAVLGSLTVCAYLLLGRRLRQSLSLLTYIWLVYSAAAITLFVVALVSGVLLTGFTPLAWACLIGLAIGPQLIGHSGINWALKHVSATFIAIAILAEPVGSAILAYFFLGERFAPLQLAGFVVLLTGIYLASRDAGGAEEGTSDRDPLKEGA